jgi:hypothetical protein
LYAVRGFRNVLDGLLRRLEHTAVFPPGAEVLISHPAGRELRSDINLTTLRRSHPARSHYNKIVTTYEWMTDRKRMHFVDLPDPENRQHLFETIARLAATHVLSVVPSSKSASHRVYLDFFQVAVGGLIPVQRTNAGYAPNCPARLRD